MDSKHNLHDPDELEFQRRNQLVQLSQIMKTLDDYKQIKKQVASIDKLLREVDLWRHQQTMSFTKDLV